MLDKERYLESIAAHLLDLPSYRRFPDDDEFQRELKTRDLYNFRNRNCGYADLKTTIVKNGSMLTLIRLNISCRRTLIYR